MVRTLENCKVIHSYGRPKQNNGICAGVVINEILLEKCQRCHFHDIRNAIKICVVCGKEFISAKPNSRICSEECKEIRRAQVRRGEEIPVIKHTLDDTLKEIDEYNRTHGTHLTYGKYKHMRFLEQLKKSREGSTTNEQRTNNTNKKQNNVR